MGASRQVILTRNPEGAVDHDILDQLAEKYPGYIGFAMVEDGEINVLNTGVSVQDIKDTLGVALPFYVLFSKEEVSEEHRQPVVLMDDKTQKPICAVFLEGDFKEFKPGTSTSIEFQVVQEYLMEKVVDIAADCNNDIGKTVERLRRNTTHRDIFANICPGADDRCELLFIFPDNSVVSAVKGTAQQSFEWGTISHSPDAKPAAAAEPPAAAKPGLLARFKNSSAAVVKDNKDKPTLKLASSTSETALAAALKTAEDKATIMVLPSKGRCNTAKSLGQWYDQFSEVGRPPEFEQGVNNWDRAIPVPLKQSWIDNKAGWKKVFEQKQAIIFDPKIHTRATVIPSSTPAPVGDAPAGDKPAATSAIEPHLTPVHEREKIVKARSAIIKASDDSNRLILDPSSVQALLSSNFPMATEEVGIKGGLDELENYSEDAFFWLAKESPRFAARLMSQYRLDRIINKKPGKKEQAKIAM